MRLLRNREVRRGLLLLTGITAALCAVGWAMAGPCCAGLLLVSGAASAAVYLVSARRRYRALADMGQDIDRVLHGLDSQTIAACDDTVCIPMTHGVDSLNVAAASAVAFYQLGNH